MSADQIPSVIKRELPNGVTYNLSWPNHVIISLPPASTWSSGLHWHESHTKYLKVIKGSIDILVGFRRRIVSASAKDQPEIKIAKFHWHEWRRAELGGEEVVVIERTVPADGERALFFWNLNGVEHDTPGLLHTHHFLLRCPTAIAQFLLALWRELHFLVIFAHLDNIPVYFDLPNSRLRKGNLIPVQTLAIAEWMLSHFILSVGALLGWVLGVQPVNRRYTPEREYKYWLFGRESEGNLE